ncbi:MAG TPA: zinc finger Ran-binding domain-containing protein [Candidatus Polarisedimenticolia bacterium]|nr:zinc finger Ran-binding domain-containing protein [Candidatus Polarisedimenticolia bacterium]
MRGVVAILAAIFLLGATAGGIAAADPTSTPRPPTCAERYPGEGPAQVDLRLGCIASELVGHYTSGGAGDPAPISTYLGPLLALVGGFALLFLAFRFVLGRGQRRMAPATPGAYWLCPACHSVNEPTRAACYSCSRPWSPDAAIVPAAERPEMVQRFGGDRKSGPD